MERKTKFAAFCVMAALLFTAVGSKNVFAVTAKSATVTEFTTNELSNSPFNMTVSIGAGVLKANVYSADAKDGWSAYFVGGSYIEGQGYSVSQFKNFASGCCDFLIDISNMDFTDRNPGKFSIQIGDKIDLGNGAGSYPSFSKVFYINSGGNEIYFPAGQSELDFYNSLSQYDPTDFDGIPQECLGYKHLDDIISLAKKVTEGCSSDEDKVLAIHDYLAENIDYYRGDDGADLDYIYENHKAVCSGYSRMARLMYGAVGIPCLNIEGFALGVGYNGAQFVEGEDYDVSNHEWNAVYVNGKWYLLDITWDSSLGGHLYYRISPLAMSGNHISEEIVSTYCYFDDELIYTPRFIDVYENPIFVTKFLYDKTYKQSKLKKKKTYKFIKYSGAIGKAPGKICSQNMQDEKTVDKPGTSAYNI